MSTSYSRLISIADWTCGWLGVQVKLWDPWEHVPYLSTSEVMICEEALYQVYIPLSLPLVTFWYHLLVGCTWHTLCLLATSVIFELERGFWFSMLICSACCRFEWICDWSLAGCIFMISRSMSCFSNVYLFEWNLVWPLIESRIIVIVSVCSESRFGSAIARGSRAAIVKGRQSLTLTLGP